MSLRWRLSRVRPRLCSRFSMLFPSPTARTLATGPHNSLPTTPIPSSLNAGSIRIDYLPTQKITIFGRYNDAPSNITQRGAQSAKLQLRFTDTVRVPDLTAGSSQAISPHLTNEFRFNYSRSRANSLQTLDNFGGAVPPPDSVLFPTFPAPAGSSFLFLGDTNPNGLRYDVGQLGNNLQQQINVTDSLSYTIGVHQLKFGMDYRRLNTNIDLYRINCSTSFSRSRISSPTRYLKHS